MSEPACGRDVLLAGPDEPERPPRQVRALGAGLVLAALLTVPSDVRTPAPQGTAGGSGAPLQLVLHVGAPRLLPAAALWRTRVQRTPVLDVVNAGPRPVTITSATLTPGLWQVRVLDDGPVPRGSGTSLALQRLVDCGRGIDDDGAVPEELVLVAEVDGQSLLHRVAVRELRGPRGAPLVDQLRAASLACGVRRGYDAG